MNKTIIIQLGIIFSIVGGYFFIDFNALLAKIQGEGNYVVQDKNCDLHKSPCSITSEDGVTYTLEVFPKTIPLMQELNFTLKTTQPVKDLTFKIYATNMFMGEFVFDLKKQSNGEYRAKGMLPTCPIGDMQWNADITKSTLTQKIGARFQFKTDI